MGKRRLAISDDEEEDEETRNVKDGSDGNIAKESAGKPEATAPTKQEEEEEEEGEEEEEEEEDFPKPVGEPIKVTGRGKKKSSYFKSFEYEGNQYELEDSVLLSPEKIEQKPYVAIIKEIIQDSDGSMRIFGQWFYRPEEADKKGGGHFQLSDTRELYYSFHVDYVPAESVMHKCVVHFIPLNKQLPIRSKFPGFVVQKVYDTCTKSLFNLEDKDYHDDKQPEIDLLVQKTRECIGELPDIEKDEMKPHPEDILNTKRLPRRRNMLLPIDVSRNDDTVSKSDLMKAETPGSCTFETSEQYTVLASCKSLTGVGHRDRALGRLLQGVESMCHKGNITSDALASDNKTGKSFSLEDAVSAVASLEKAANDSLGTDFLKYNQKMRTLVFNLKMNPLLARRLLNRELEPSVILNMSPTELKEGLTAVERNTKEPDRSERMQMTDARCKRCSEKTVGVADVIQAGGSGDRYQLECISCGHQWYASRDAISSLTIDTPVVGNVGTAPWATAKFEDVQKKLVSPRESEKPSPDIFQKKSTSQTAPHVPLLEPQRSFKVKEEESPAATVD